MLVFFTIVSLIEVLISYLTLICLFSIIDSFEWFCMGSRCRNIQLILVLLKAPSFVLHFSHCTLITFLMVLSLILTILLSTLNVIKHMVCDNNWSWLWIWPIWFVITTKVGSEYGLWDTVDSGKKGLLQCWKHSAYFVDQFNNSVAIAVKIDRYVLKGK